MAVALHINLDLMSVKLCDALPTGLCLYTADDYVVYYHHDVPACLHRFCEFDGSYFAADAFIHTASPEQLPPFRFTDASTGCTLSMRVGPDWRPYICCDCADACGVCCG